MLVEALKTGNWSAHLFVCLAALAVVGSERVLVAVGIQAVEVVAVV